MITLTGNCQYLKAGQRSATEQPSRSPFLQQFPPMMMQDPRLNPMFNPNSQMPPLNQPWMFPPGGFDPRFPPQSGLQDPRLLQRFVPPQSDWSEMILIFPDGSFQHTIRDNRVMVILFTALQRSLLLN